MRVITTRLLGSRQRENQASTEPGAVQLCLDDTFADAEPKTLRYGGPAHRRATGPRPRQTEDRNPGYLALGPGTRSRVRRRVRPRPDLASRTPTARRTRGTPSGQWNRRHPTRSSGTHNGEKDHQGWPERPTLEPGEMIKAGDR